MAGCLRTTEPSAKFRSDSMHIPIRPIPTRVLTGSLHPAGCEMLAKISTQLEFPPNHLIFRANEEPAAMWMVTHGRACISFPEKEDAGTRVCGRGIFGLTETIAGIPYQESLFTDSYCTCTRVDRESLIELLQNEHDASWTLLRVLSRNYLKSVRNLASKRP